MNDIARCPECGSFDRQCAFDEPSPVCGCSRCLRAELAEAKAEVTRRVDKGNLYLADNARLAQREIALCVEIKSLRAELAAVNNEFGSETAEWPEAWRRVSDLKDRGRILWQENETLRAEVDALKAKLKRYERADEDASLDRAIKAASSGGEAAFKEAIRPRQQDTPCGALSGGEEA